MKYIYSLLLVFAASCFATGELMAADPLYIKVPEVINIEKTKIKDLVIDTNIKNILWFVPDERLTIISISDTRAIIQGITDATVYINFFYAEDGKVKGPIKLKVIVGQGDNPLPPPVPPGPVPPVPGPSSDFEKAVAAAYAADSSTKDKLTARTTLITFYKNGINVVIKDKDVDTVGKLYGVLSLTANEFLGDNLVPVRKEIQKYLDSKLPTATGTIINAELRSAFEAEFNKVIAALEKI